MYLPHHSPLKKNTKTQRFLSNNPFCRINSEVSLRTWAGWIHVSIADSWIRTLDGRVGSDVPRCPFSPGKKSPTLWSSRKKLSECTRELQDQSPGCQTQPCNQILCLQRKDKLSSGHQKFAQKKKVRVEFPTGPSDTKLSAANKKKSGVKTENPKRVENDFFQKSTVSCTCEWTCFIEVTAHNFYSEKIFVALVVHEKLIN